jgi:hypothetical protein
VTGSAAALEDLTRWLGMAITVVGALAVNPDATANAWHSFQGQVVRSWRPLRGFLARLIPCLRRNTNVLAGTASGLASLNVAATGYARGVVGWGPNATTAAKIAILDRRTLALDKELGELQRKVDTVEKRLRNALADAVAELRGEAVAIRETVEDLRRETVRLDASALPIIVVGFVLSGLAPDATRFQVWFWCLVVLGAVAFTIWRARHIYRDWRRASGLA